MKAYVFPHTYQPAGDIAPVYCCYNPATGEHFYTMSEAERDAFIQQAKQQVGLAEQQAILQRQQQDEQDRQRRESVVRRYVDFRRRDPAAVGLLGVSIRIGNVEWTVTKAQRLGTVFKTDPIIGPNNKVTVVETKAQGQFILVEIRVEYKGNEPKELDEPPILFDDRSREFKHSDGLQAHLVAVPRLTAWYSLSELEPNVPFTSCVIYDVPQDAKGLALLVDDLSLRLWDKVEGAIDLGLE